MSWAPADSGPSVSHGDGELVADGRLLTFTSFSFCNAKAKHSPGGGLFVPKASLHGIMLSSMLERDFESFGVDILREAYSLCVSSVK